MIQATWRGERGRWRHVSQTEHAFHDQTSLLVRHQQHAFLHRRGVRAALKHAGPVHVNVVEHARACELKVLQLLERKEAGLLLAQLEAALRAGLVVVLVLNAVETRQALAQFQQRRGECKNSAAAQRLL